MLEITAETAGDYLRTTGRVVPNEPAQVRELAGGVSNVVLLVTLPARGERFVLKQARGQLRVKEEWLCPVERIWREADVLRACGAILQSAAQTKQRTSRTGDLFSLYRPVVPQILWEDRANYCFAMTAAPPRNRTWKT